MKDKRPISWLNAQKTRMSRKETVILSKSILLEESGAPTIVSILVAIVSSVVLAFILWASLTRVDEIAQATGEAVPVGQVKKVQSEHGGSVSEILVENGDAVSAGQVLVRLDHVAAGTKLEQSLKQKYSLMAQQERLKSMAERREPDFSAIPQRYATFIDDQKNLLKQMRESNRIKRDILQSQVTQFTAGLKELDNREKSVRENYQLIKDEFDTYQELHKQSLVGKIEFNQVKRLYIQVQENMTQLPVQRLQLLEKLNESRNKLDKFDIEVVETSLADLAKVNDELAQVSETLTRMEKDARQTDLKAPETGVVHELKVHTLGQVVSPGGTVLDIVPKENRLVVEAQISPKDVGHLHTGLTATCKFTAYDFSRYGGVKGKLVDISATTSLNEKGVPYYKGIIELDRPYVGPPDAGRHVLPGMNAQVDIKTGNRTVMQYLLKPIYTSLNQAFRER